MARLNLNFQEDKDYRNPTKREIVELEFLTMNVNSVIKVLAGYVMDNANNELEEVTVNTIGVLNALELLMEPIVDYMSNYAGKTPTEEKET